MCSSQLAVAGTPELKGFDTKYPCIMNLFAALSKVSFRSARSYPLIGPLIYTLLLISCLLIFFDRGNDLFFVLL